MKLKSLEGDQLDQVVHVRLTGSEKSQLREDADLASLTVSALVRRRCLGRPVAVREDQVVIKELRRLGSHLQQLLERDGDLCRGDIASALRSVITYMDERTTNP